MLKIEFQYGWKQYPMAALFPKQASPERVLSEADVTNNKVKKQPTEERKN